MAEDPVLSENDVEVVSDKGYSSERGGMQLWASHLSEIAKKTMWVFNYPSLTCLGSDMIEVPSDIEEERTEVSWALWKRIMSSSNDTFLRLSDPSEPFH